MARKRRLIWTQPAVDQLDDIAAFIALDDVGAAMRLVAECLESVELLIQYPQSGRVPPELPKERYREVIVPPCRIVYRREGNDILIVHVLRGEQRLRRRKLG